MKVILIFLLVSHLKYNIYKILSYGEYNWLPTFSKCMDSFVVKREREIERETEKWREREKNKRECRDSTPCFYNLMS